MSRADFLRILAALVSAGSLTRDEGQALVGAFDRGELAETDVPAGPLTAAGLAAAVRTAYRRGRRRAAEAFARSVGATLPPGDAATTRALAALDRANRTRRLAALRAADVDGAVRREARRRTAVLFADRDAATFGPGDAGSARRSAGSVERWQAAMRQAYADDAATYARLGAGRELTPAQTRRLAEVVRGRAAYADAHAAALTRAAAGLEAAPTELQVASRLVRASGPGRELYYRNDAQRAVGAGPGPDTGEGYVVAYRTNPGDRCGPCVSAEGEYRADGPFPVPSSVCLGGGLCRCTVEIRYDPDAYARLP